MTLDYKLIPNLYENNFIAHITLGSGEQGEVQIYNINGILKGKHIIGSGDNTLDLSEDGLSAGLYIYKVLINGQTKTVEKLVVVN